MMYSCNVPLQRNEWPVKTLSAFLTLFSEIYSREELECLWCDVLANRTPSVTSEDCSHVSSYHGKKGEYGLVCLRRQDLSVLAKYAQLS